MIDPRKLTQYDRTQFELEEFFLFCCIADASDPEGSAKLLDDFLRVVFGKSPFNKISRLARYNTLVPHIKNVGIPHHARYGLLFSEATKLDLAHCSISDLENLKGSNSKIARMFILHTRVDQNIAAIDSHVLEFLSSKGIKVPKAPPPLGPTYRRLENEILKQADDAGMTPAQYDLLMWNSCSPVPNYDGVRELGVQ